jgi:hypothetical protein
MASSNPHLATPATFEKALNETFNHTDDDFTALFNAMWSPNLQATIDGKPFDRDGLYTHLQTLRAAIAEGKLTCLTLIKEGNKFAERHRGEATMKDGGKTDMDAFAFGELGEDGRIVKFEEAVIIRGSHPMRQGEGKQLGVDDETK